MQLNKQQKVKKLINIISYLVMKQKSYKDLFKASLKPRELIQNLTYLKD